jgi:hypothetical protein
MHKEVRQVIDLMYDLGIRHMKGADASAERIEAILKNLDTRRAEVADLEKRLENERAIWAEHERRRLRARTLIERIELDCYEVEHS